MQDLLRFQQSFSWQKCFLPSQNFVSNKLLKSCSAWIRFIHSWHQLAVVYFVNAEVTSGGDGVKILKIKVGTAICTPWNTKSATNSAITVLNIWKLDKKSLISQQKKDVHVKDKLEYYADFCIWMPVIQQACPQIAVNKPGNPPVSAVQSTEYWPFSTKACNTHSSYGSEKA